MSDNPLTQMREALESAIKGLQNGGWMARGERDKIKQALQSLQGKVIVDEERLEVILTKTCPPHRDLNKTCELNIPCIECRRTYLTKEATDDSD